MTCESPVSAWQTRTALLMAPVASRCGVPNVS